MANKRGNVWLAVSGLVISEDGKWLVVKKRYSGLKGVWSLPAGFVQEGETADEAVVREIKEETGLNTSVIGLIGLRTGVIEDKISDNMLIFLVKSDKQPVICIQEEELEDVQFFKPSYFRNNGSASEMLKYLADLHLASAIPVHEGINPGDQFGYTMYKLFV
ncbi:NUDIX hydrolase [Bacillaceae bacterium Marseille-Q3522]|nr:NUDIX hydrolase [Bacillaceae bacterium Marseille-Q3522]